MRVGYSHPHFIFIIVDGDIIMIVEISEMINYLDEFADGDLKETLVGGIAGTEINKFAIDAATRHHKFNKVLIIEGCQDYIGLMKNPLPNVKHWGDLFVEDVIEPLVPFDPWKPKVAQPNAVPTYTNRIDVEKLSHYEMMVVFDAQLIPRRIQSAISYTFSGQIIWVYDPAEPNGHTLVNQQNIPVVIDTLRKLSPILALARDALGIETRAVDRKVKGSVVETSKMNKRSIGKIDDKQYVGNDYDFTTDILNKQYDSPFRKNQRVLVSSDIVDMMTENGVRKTTIGYNSMLVIENPNSKPLMKLRLYNSKTYYFGDITYDRTSNIRALMRRDQIRVRPANIIVPDEVKYHRYNHTVVVLGYPLNRYEKYSVLKNSNNVTVVNKFKT